MQDDTVVIGYDRSEAARIAEAIRARFMAVPAGNDEEVWEAWRDGAASLNPVGKVVVALFPALRTQDPVNTITTEDWTLRLEQPMLHWMVALGAASSLCADGGTILAVTDGPPPLDAAGLAPEAAIAENVSALVRSLALSEGKRRVRANAIVTPYRLVLKPPIAPAPPLPGFPGTLDEDVIGMVTLLLSAEAAYLSGHTLPADRGRSW